MRKRRQSEENGFADDDRRPDKSRGHFAGIVDNVGCELASSAQLKHVETTDSGVFGVKMGCFSSFWQFSTKSADAERVLRAVTIEVDAGDSVDGCDSKTAHKSALFSCLVHARRCESCGELATVE